MTIDDILTRYIRHRGLLISGGYKTQLEVSVRLLKKYTGVTCFEDLDWETFDRFRMRLSFDGRSPRTVNGRTQSILTIWRFARRKHLTETEPVDVEPLPVPRRIPRAWNGEEMARLLAACDGAPRRRTWTGRHWKALVYCLYDTGLRIGCLLRVPRSAVQGDRLWIPAEEQKGRAETMHRLHRDTLAAIEALPMTERLFDWPFSDRSLWPYFRKDVLKPAKLPASRRDLFHKIRRTSYTLVYSTLGPQAATHHAAHTCDLSKHYLDPTMLEHKDVIDVLPRPGQERRKTDEWRQIKDQLAKIAERLSSLE